MLRYYGNKKIYFARLLEYLDFANVNGLNLYSCCNNNPVNYSDGSGHMPEWLSTTLKIVGGVAIIAGCIVGSIFTGGTFVVLAGAAIGATTSGIGAAVSGGNINDFANAFLMSTLTGAISGAVASSPLGVGAQIGINSVLSMANYVGVGAICGWIGQSGWMQGQTTSVFVAFAGKNALKHVVGMVGMKSLLEMTLPGILLGGIGGGMYARASSIINPNGNFIGF